MAKYHSLRVWQLAMANLALVQEDLPKIKGLTDVSNQMRRCAQSVVANICEGSGRGYDGEFKKFLCTARGSNHELLSWLFM